MPASRCRGKQDTIINVWSTTKTVAALALPDARRPRRARPLRAGRHVLARVRGRGQGRHRGAPRDEPHGRAVGLAGADHVRGPLRPRARRPPLLAAQAPWWEPGTASGYHAITQGYLEGEIVQRVTGQSLGEFVAENITGPLGADFHIGTPAEHDARVAHVIPPPPMPLPDGRRPDQRARQDVRQPDRSTPTQSWDDRLAAGRDPGRRRPRQRPLGRPGPHADGVRRRGQRRAPASARRRSTPCSTSSATAPTSCSASPLRHGIGFGLPSPEMPISPNERTCFWGGWGGSLAIIDLDARMSFAYVMNKMGEGTVGDMRGAGLLIATYLSLGQLTHPPSVWPSECQTPDGSSARTGSDTRMVRPRRRRGRGCGRPPRGARCGRRGGTRRRRQQRDRRGAAAAVDEAVDEPAAHAADDGAQPPRPPSTVDVAAMIHDSATSAAGRAERGVGPVEDHRPSGVSMMLSGWKSRCSTSSGAPKRTGSPASASVADRHVARAAGAARPTCRRGAEPPGPRSRSSASSAVEPLHHEVGAVGVEHLRHRDSRAPRTCRITAASRRSTWPRGRRHRGSDAAPARRRCRRRRRPDRVPISGPGSATRRRRSTPAGRRRTSC